jgi:mono/diheme cytochrome c family protein
MIEAARNRINSRSSAVLYSATGIGAAILVGGLIIVAVAKPATATPAYAAQTKLACGRCHTSPAGGGFTYQFWQSLCRERTQTTQETVVKSRPIPRQSKAAGSGVVRLASDRPMHRV